MYLDTKMEKMEKITYFDLVKNRNKYTIQQLETNLNHLEIKHILQYQTLTSDFCAKYVLNEDYASCQEDLYLIDIGYVLYHQKHLTYDEIIKSLEELEDTDNNNTENIDK